jgi:hypothetical protein
MLQGLNRWFRKGATEALHQSFGFRYSAYLTSDQTKNASVVMGNITDLSIPVLGNTTYAVRAVVYLTIAAAGDGINFDFDASTCTATSMAFLSRYSHTGAATDDKLLITSTLAGDIDGATSTAWDLLVVEGTIEVATPGTVAMRFCQSSSGSSNSVAKKGSYMTATRIPLS